MSIAHRPNPMPRKAWLELKQTLAKYGVLVHEEPKFILDAVGDEYMAFAQLYVGPDGPGEAP